MRAIGLGLLVASSVALAQAPDEFRGTAVVTVSGNEGLHRVELPFEAYRLARRGLPDLRFFNGRGEALPFAFAAAAPTEPPAREAVAVPLFPVRSAPGAPEGDVRLDVRAARDGTLIALRPKPTAPAAARTTAWVADASAVKEPIGSVVVEWERKPGTEVARVSLEASEDLKSWQPLASGQVVDLHHDGRALSQPRLEFGAQKVKYLRVSSRTDGFALTGLRVERTRSVPEAPRQLVTVGGAALNEPGRFAYDLQAAVPVDRVQVLLPQTNTVAPVQLYAREDEKSEWRSVTSATFYRLTRGGEELKSEPVVVPSYAARYWRVDIDPKSGLGDAAPRLEARWTPAHVVFASRGEGPYRVAFGHPDTKPAALPVATLIPGYERGAEWKVPAAKVEPVREMASTEPSWRAIWRGVNGRKVTLWAVLAGGVLLLGFMAWRLNRQVGAPPPGQ